MLNKIASTVATDGSKAHKALKIGLAIALPLGTGAIIYWAFISKTKEGITRWQKWTKKDGSAVPAGGGSSSSSNTTAFKTGSNTSSGAQTGGGASSSGSTGFPLSMGSSGSNVKSLQTALNASQNAGLVVDGQLGSLTSAALKKAGYSLPLSQSSYNTLIGDNSAAVNFFDSLVSKIV
jgi:hypothetical protein